MPDLNSILGTRVYTTTKGEPVDLRLGAEWGAWMHDSYHNPDGLLRIELNQQHERVEALAAAVERLLAAGGPPAVAGPVDVDALADAVAARLIARLTREG